MFPQRFALFACREYSARGQFHDGPPHERRDLLLNGRRGEMDLDQMADDLSGNGGEQLVPRCPDLHRISVAQRPAEAAEADVPRQV